MGKGKKREDSSPDDNKKSKTNNPFQNSTSGQNQKLTEKQIENIIRRKNEHFKNRSNPLQNPSNNVPQKPNPIVNPIKENKITFNANPNINNNPFNSNPLQKKSQIETYSNINHENEQQNKLIKENKPETDKESFQYYVEHFDKNPFNYKTYPMISGFGVMLTKYEGLKRGFKIENEDKFFQYLNDCTKLYLKQCLTKLIEVSRIRNSVFSFFNKSSTNGIQKYKVNTTNINMEDKDKDSFIPYKSFDILFTRNLKQEFNLVNTYTKLKSNKRNLEYMLDYKTKLEAAAKRLGNEQITNINPTPVNILGLGPGRKKGKKGNGLIRTMKSKFEKTKKQEETDRMKSCTKNTLDTFLDKDIKKFEEEDSVDNSSEENNSAEKEKENLLEDDLFLSNMNSTEFNKPIGAIRRDISFKDPFGFNMDSNTEININIFRNNTLDNETNFNKGERKIVLKDFLIFLEGCENFFKTPRQGNNKKILVFKKYELLQKANKTMIEQYNHPMIEDK